MAPFGCPVCIEQLGSGAVLVNSNQSPSPKDLGSYEVTRKGPVALLEIPPHTSQITRTSSGCVVDESVYPAKWSATNACLAGAHPANCFEEDAISRNRHKK